MDTKKDPAENSIVDLIDDTDYYQFKKDKQQVENATWAIYIFTTVSLLFYVIYLLIFRAGFNWVNTGINIIVIIVYYCLGSYSNDRPFNAFIAFLGIVGIFFLTDLFLAPKMNFIGLSIKIVLIVYISMRLEAAKKVQVYEKQHPK